MWNLRTKTDEHRGRGKKREGSKPEESFHYREQTEGCWREVGGGWAKWVMGIKEGTCWDGRRVLYGRDESVNSTPETKRVN